MAKRRVRSRVPRIQGSLAHVRREARASLRRLQRIALERIRGIEREIEQLGGEREMLVESFGAVLDGIRHATQIAGRRRTVPALTPGRWQTAVVSTASGKRVAPGSGRAPGHRGSPWGGHLSLVGGRAAWQAQPETKTLREVERDHIAAVLTRCDWNQSQAAIRLGIGRNTLMRKVKSFGLKKVPRDAKAA